MAREGLICEHARRLLLVIGLAGSPGLIRVTRLQPAEVFR